MERIWITKTSDGVVFEGTDINQVESEANAHELELSKKKMEASERQRKAEEERKIKAEKERQLMQYRNKKCKEFTETINKLSAELNEYEKYTGYKILFCIDEKENVEVRDTRNSIDFAWDNVVEDMLNFVVKVNKI